MPNSNFDFGGYATKSNIKCTDGRTILPNAFEEQHGTTVPLVWQHMHNEPGNVLGHAVLENREDGVYAYGYFNDSAEGQKAKILVMHGDIASLSIYANQLIEKSKHVAHGVIREVSLVLSGANPGAKIDNIVVAHADGEEFPIDEEAIIHSGEELEVPLSEFEKYYDFEEEEDDDEDLAHDDGEEADESEDDDEEFAHEDAQPTTIGDVLATLSAEQRAAVYTIIGAAATGEKPSAEKASEVKAIYDGLTDDQTLAVEALIGQMTGGKPAEGDAEHSALESEVNEENSDEGEEQIIMKTNVFDRGTENNAPSLSHEQFQSLLKEGQRLGSLKAAFIGDADAKAFLAHAGTYGIDNPEYLFPDAMSVTQEPTFIARKMGWVAKVMGSTHHTPFSRIKSLHADVTADEARALGYVTGDQKVEEVFPILRRTTTPQTVYKLQKLDRDDVVDITDFSVVAWLKREMRFMLDEELARAILVGDGRSGVATDKISETNIRPVWGDSSVYTYHKQVAVGRTDDELIDDLITARINYRGTGNPTLFVAPSQLTAWLLLKDLEGRRLYRSVAELALEFRVAEIVEVPVMEGLSRTDTVDYDLRAIMVNLADYTVGADKGGEINMFDDFDIDFNQYKYLIETRVSGALVTPGAAVVLEQAQA